jgi:hypothetical protein
MHRIGHEHVGVQGTTTFFEGFAQPVTVSQIVIFTEETGIAVGGQAGHYVAAHRLGECEGVEA